MLFFALSGYSILSLINPLVNYAAREKINFGSYFRKNSLITIKIVISLKTKHQKNGILIANLKTKILP